MQPPRDVRTLWPANPLQRLELAAELLRDVHPSLAAYLRTGVETHLRTGEPFDRCMGISRERGLLSPREELLSLRRNALLHEAWVAAGSSVAVLERELDRYRELPAHQRASADPRAHWTPLRCVIHAAASQGLSLPKGNQLRAILRRATSLVAFELEATSSTMGAFRTGDHTMESNEQPTPEAGDDSEAIAASWARAFGAAAAAHQATRNATAPSDNVQASWDRAFGIEQEN
jgi:hypothetical protein